MTADPRVALALVLLLMAGCESKAEWWDDSYSSYCKDLKDSISWYESNRQQQVRKVTREIYEKDLTKWEATCRMVPK